MALASGCRLTMAAAALILAASCSVPAAEPPLNEQLVDGQTLYVTDGDTVRLASGERGLPPRGDPVSMLVHSVC